MKSACVCALALIVATPAFSNTVEQEPAKPRQPLQELFRTEVVYPQEKGELQLTVGSLFEQGRTSDSVVVPVGVEYGLTDAWQVGLEWNSFTYVRSLGPAVGGTGDLAFGTKYSFINILGSAVHVALGRADVGCKDSDLRDDGERHETGSR